MRDAISQHQSLRLIIHWLMRARCELDGVYFGFFGWRILLGPYLLLGPGSFSQMHREELSNNSPTLAEIHL
jgi:hypothetical protein